ncbi:type II secretion system protein GspJ [Sphingomonas sp. AOB5]|uniref:type II secretion system protein GspJ n=1 Tax=Sphingomonas sp. AOB5 TaxID=3034017 RepID=UPI0023F8C23E|nr:type II secretion system protein GspJ [Sphingomonas sp. AOB5]MDF7777726.1 type II secretion system protein GspJ [Sphingomonas sp. AOB5]
MLDGRPGGGAGWCRTPAEPAKNAEQGFTLIELMISLGLFALIATAGLALVQGVLNVQGRTEARLDRLAEFQRAMFVITSDLDQISVGQVSGGGPNIKFSRTAPGTGGRAAEVQYALTGDTLIRGVGRAQQQLLPGVAAVRWRFYDNGWIDAWPRSEEEANRWPQAIEVEMQVVAPKAGGAAGSLRRVVVLPTRGDGQ